MPIARRSKGHAGHPLFTTFHIRRRIPCWRAEVVDHGVKFTLRVYDPYIQTPTKRGIGSGYERTVGEQVYGEVLAWSRASGIVRPTPGPAIWDYEVFITQEEVPEKFRTELIAAVVAAKIKGV